MVVDYYEIDALLNVVHRPRRQRLCYNANQWARFVYGKDGTFARAKRDV